MRSTRTGAGSLTVPNRLWGPPARYSRVRLPNSPNTAAVSRHTNTTTRTPINRKVAHPAVVMLSVASSVSGIGCAAANAPSSIALHLSSDAWLFNGESGEILDA